MLSTAALILKYHLVPSELQHKNICRCQPSLLMAGCPIAQQCVLDCFSSARGNGARSWCCLCLKAPHLSRSPASGHGFRVCSHNCFELDLFFKPRQTIAADAKKAEGTAVAHIANAEAFGEVPFIDAFLGNVSFVWTSEINQGMLSRKPLLSLNFSLSVAVKQISN